MKQLKDLKEEFLNNKFNNIYVFYGEDFGLRKHYIDYIARQFEEIIVLDNYETMANNRSVSSLIKTKILYIIYNCNDILDITLEQLQVFKNKIQDDCVIFDYEELKDSSNLFKYFSDYITYFPLVKDNIGVEFVKSELNLLPKSRKEIAYNSYNNYSVIKLESDKVKSYAGEKNISEEQSYEILSSRDQMSTRVDDFNSDLLMNDVLSMNVPNFAYWYSLIKSSYEQEFWYSLSKLMNDFIIAYCLQRWGSYNGSSIAYKGGFSWGRIKTIKELKIRMSLDQLLSCAATLCGLDYRVKTGLMRVEELLDYFFCIML